jgi:Uncharacterized protein conserved in bacteria (DUF2188)
MARVVYRVLPDSGDWKLTREGVDQRRFLVKTQAVAYGQQQARSEWEVYRRPTQLVVHKADGTFEYEYTYGQDPFPPTG